MAPDPDAASGGDSPGVAETGGGGATKNAHGQELYHGIHEKPWSGGVGATQPYKGVVANKIGQANLRHPAKKQVPARRGWPLTPPSIKTLQRMEHPGWATNRHHNQGHGDGSNPNPRPSMKPDPEGSVSQMSRRSSVRSQASGWERYSPREPGSPSDSPSKSQRSPRKVGDASSSPTKSRTEPRSELSRMQRSPRSGMSGSEVSGVQCSSARAPMTMRSQTAPNLGGRRFTSGSDAVSGTYGSVKMNGTRRNPDNTRKYQDSYCSIAHFEVEHKHPHQATFGGYYTRSGYGRNYLRFKSNARIETTT